MIDPLSVSIPLSAPRAEELRPQRKLLRPCPDHPDDYFLELDYSSASDFLACPRSSENKLIRGREAQRETTATSFGRLFHKCEEIRLHNGFGPATTAEQLSHIENHFVHNPVPPDEYRTSSRMIDVLLKYEAIYKDDNWPAKVLRVDGQPFIERPFKIELCTIAVNALIPYSRELLIGENGGHNGVFVRNLHIIYIGKIDAVLQDETGLWVVDHKTSSRGGREFIEAFRLSLQTRGYAYATKKILPPELSSLVRGLSMNAVIVRPLTKTGTGTEFNRHPFFYSDDSITEWEQNMKSIVSDFVAMLVRGFFPQHARSFKSPCAGCDYSENCPLPFSQRAADLSSNLYRDVTWSPMYE